MRLAKDDESALAATIKATGFEKSNTTIDCLAFSPASAETNKEVHAKTNEQLLTSLLRKSAGNCVHITGEMRALSDPFHRRLCAEIAQRTDTRFTVVYDIPLENSATPEGVGRWNAQKWRSKGWAEKLSAMNLVGQALVDVRASQTIHEIQYSVFGNKYVLLQEKHVDEGVAEKSKAKRIWLLESEKLNSHLTERAFKIVDNSRDIPEALFKRFFTSMTGITARNILSKLAVTGSADLESLLDRHLLDFSPDAQITLDSLSEMEFVGVDDRSICSITSNGRHFLEKLK